MILLGKKGQLRFTVTALVSLVKFGFVNVSVVE